MKISWQWTAYYTVNFMTLITSIDELPPALAASVKAEEKKYIDEITHNASLHGKHCLPFAVTPHYASLAGPEQNDPIRRQFFPDPREALPDPFALDDPLGECNYLAAPNLIHRYPDRALLLSSSSCAGYCRHCFRRVWLNNGIKQVYSKELLKCIPPIIEYLAEHTEIRELLISGGDPLTLDNDYLANLFNRLRKARPDIILRVCTKVPITEPSRLDSETVSLFIAFRPLKLSVHINHPRELSPQSRNVFSACTAAGIPVLVQTVLLRGINDNAVLLAELCRTCFELGLKPYYLFQPDLAPGTAHFRVPFKSGLAIYRELAKLCSVSKSDLHNYLPVYAVDLPGGGGKIRLHDNVIAGERTTVRGNEYVLKDEKGREWYYPIE